MRLIPSILLLVFAVSAAAAQPIIDVDDLRPFFAAAKHERVDVVGIGDSNQLFVGAGWDAGWQTALDERFEIYGTGVVSLGDNMGRGSGSGYLYSGLSSVGPEELHYTGAPPEADIFLNSEVSLLIPNNYVYVNALSTHTANGPFGLVLDRESPIDVKGPLAWTLWHGKFAGVGAGGTFTPGVRLEDFPFTIIARGNLTVSWAGIGQPFEVTTTQVRVPASSVRNYPLSFRPALVGEQIVGPFIGYYSRIVNESRPRGVAVSVLYALGSQSLRDMAAALQNSSDESLMLYFAAVREGQPGSRKVLVRISSALNDRAENLPSVGGGISPGSSAAAYEDNLRYILERIKAVWAASNWDPQDLYFLIAPSHPVTNPDEAILTAYRQRADLVAREYPRTASVRFDRITNANELLSNHWYQQGGADTNHLVAEAYSALASREVMELVRPVCIVDFNNDGGVDGADVEAFFRAWVESDFLCDVNIDGGVDGFDVGAFLELWSTGGCE